MCMDFSVGWLNAKAANYHGYGFQLRCLSE